MKYFESSGLWYPADDSSSAVGGTLHFTAEGLRLRLLGSFRPGWAPSKERYPVIRGVMGENPYGTFVTLLDCLRSNTKINMAGITSESITSNMAVIGRSHLPAAPIRFKTAGLRFSYLNHWVGRDAIESDMVHGEPLGFVIRYQKPPAIPMPLGDADITIGFTFGAHTGAYRAEISENANIFVDNPGDRSIDAILGDFVMPLQSLLAFATDTPNEIEEVHLVGEDDRGERDELLSFNLVNNPIFRLEQEKEFLSDQEMLFTLDDALAAGLNIFRNWFDFARKHDAFCTVYFAQIHAQARYLDDNFSKLMSAFTLLCASSLEPSSRAQAFVGGIAALRGAHFAEAEQDYLVESIPTATEVEMPFHLLRLLEENCELMGQIIDGDFSDFVAAAVNTLSYVERRASQPRRRFWQGEHLYHATRTIRMLIKIIILKQLGFDADRVKTLIERNNYFLYLKSV